MSDNYNILIFKLDRFVRKYYKNQLIRGALFSIAALLGFFIIINFLEYFAWFGPMIRASLFYLYIVAAAIIIVRLIIIPLLRLFHFGKVISHEQASIVIGKHFGDVKDSLLNTLQLKKLADTNITSSELLYASIDQKISKLKPIPFGNVINLAANKRYFKFAAPPILILLVVLFTAPSLITGPSDRLLRYNTFFEKPAPFEIVILNKKLEASQQENYQIDVKVKGDEIPSEVFVTIGENEYKMEKESNVLFHHIFKNVRKTIRFSFFADGFRTREYELKVMPRPMVTDFSVDLQYPAYTGKQNESFNNSGDLTVPYGTNIVWKIKTRDTKLIQFSFKDKTLRLDPESQDYFTCSRPLFLSQIYSITTFNEYMKNLDSLQYSISVIPDEFPGISVDEFRDSVYIQQIYYKGVLNDDYGFSRLLFHYTIKRAEPIEDKETEGGYLPVPFESANTRQEFFYHIDMGTLQIGPGDDVEYYFEIWDNDGVNGEKASRSAKRVFHAPTEKELEKQSEQSQEQIKNELDLALKETQILQQELDKLDKELFDKKTLSWQEKKQIQDLIDKQQTVQQRIEDLKQMNLENNIREQQYKTVDPEILEKQKQIEKLFDELMTDEMKELFRQMQEMLDKLDKKQVDEMMDKMKLSTEDLKKELDRQLELFKQLEFEKQLTETIDKLEKLAEKQKDLSEKSNEENSKTEEIQKKQEELNKEFEEIRKDLDSLQKKNEELEESNDLKNTDEQENSIQQEQKNSSDQLQKKKKKGASESQKNAGEQMDQLADDLQDMQDNMNEENAEEDYNLLREILENLIKVSFSQEGLMKDITSVKTTDPKFVEMMDQQKNIEDDLHMIQDSLYALSKRQPMIEHFINTEIAQINDNLDKALDALHNRSSGMAARWQQYVMTSVNNLALMLAESLQQMQQQMQQSKNCKSGKGGKCKKPGQGKPSASSMKQMQEALNKKIEELKKQMDGKTPGKQGQGQGQQSMSEQLARLAAEQEALRQMLQEYGEELKKEGTGNDGNISEMMKQMEQTETDLVNKMLSNETLKRQQDILTRLLESEKAEKERELDQKRESNEAENKNFSNPNQFFEYNSIKSKELELLKTVPASLKSFYKYKVNEYFYNFGE